MSGEKGKLNIDSEEMRLYQQEWLILQFTELVADIMEEKGIRKKDLAEKLGRTKGYITQLLDGRANMTLRTVSDIMWALGCSLSVDVRTLGFEVSPRFAYSCTTPTIKKPWLFRKMRPVSGSKKGSEKQMGTNKQWKLAG